VVTSPADTTAQETKNEVQIKGKGQSEVDAIHQKTRPQTGTHLMGTAKQCHHKQAKETTVFVSILSYTVGHHTRVQQPNLP
jgi:hypothetical protein